MACAEQNFANTTRPDFTPSQLDQNFDQGRTAITQLKSYANSLEQRKSLPAGCRRLSYPDAHKLIAELGVLIDEVNTRYHTGAPFWPYTKAKKTYNNIENYCKRAREIVEQIEAKDVGDFEKERAAFGDTSVRTDDLSGYQVRQISVKTERVLLEIQHAARLFEVYRDQTKRNKEERQVTLAKDLESITKAMGAVTSLLATFVQPVQIQL